MRVDPGSPPPDDDDIVPVLFLQIPKSGSSTMAQIIYDDPMFYDSKDVPRTSDDEYYQYGIYYYPGGFLKDPPDYRSPYWDRLAKVEKLRVLLGHFSYGIHRAIGGRGRYVTMIRDPVDRILSLYGHMRGQLHDDVDLMRFVMDCPVDGWRGPIAGDGESDAPDDRRVKLASRAMVDNDQVRRISGMEPAFGACGTAELDLAKDNLRRSFSVVGTTERFDEMLMLVCMLTGSSTDPVYVPRLVNPWRPRKSEITALEREAIEQRNSLDRQLHDYVNDLLDEQVASAGDGFAARLDAFRTLNARHLEKYADVAASYNLGRPAHQ